VTDQYSIFFDNFKKISKYIDRIGKIAELLLFWISFYPVTWNNVINGHFLETPLKKKQIHNTAEALQFAKMSIERIQLEYDDRNRTSSEKMKILLQIITFVFTITTGLLAYSYKNFQGQINFFFIMSIVLLLLSLFMIIAYYKVKAHNSLTFEEKFTENSEIEYYADLLLCVEMNNCRLDYFITMYKSAIRFFTLALLCLVIAVIKQF
jgi:hypothetical protein